MIISADELKEVVPDPQWIVQELDKIVIGQTAAKKTLSLLVLNRALLWLQGTGKIAPLVPFEKSNAILLGPSGTGKTALIHALEEVCDIPILIYDVSGLTSAGYVGESIDDLLFRYIDYIGEYVSSYSCTELIEFGDEYVNLFTEQKPAGSLELYARDMIRHNMKDYGIIYLDEIDKIRCTRTPGDKDINGDSVQNELLKVLEGHAPLQISEGRNTTNRKDTVNTKNISFIVGGAFSGIEEFISRRVLSNERIGFSAETSIKGSFKKKELLHQVTTQDLIDYGFKPEFLGRIPLRATLDSLSLDIMIRIIKEPKNSVLEQYISMFAMYEKNLTFDESGIQAIAERAINLEMGARSLKSLFHMVLTDELFNLYCNPESEIVITKDIVDKRCSNF